MGRFKKTYVDTGIAPSAKVYATMGSTIATGDEYQWNYDGTDGLRSYSYAASDPNWNYNTEPDESNKNDKGAYLFSDSSTGQPSARRGNLYNFTAATLGSGLKVTTKGGQTQDSICPRNWQLPITTSSTSASATEMTNKSFAKLIKIYDISSNGATSANRISEWPLQFPRTGYYGYSSGYVSTRTTSGYWWSGVAYNATFGYNLGSYQSAIDSQSYWSRGSGLARRCVSVTTKT